MWYAEVQIRVKWAVVTCICSDGSDWVDITASGTVTSPDSNRGLIGLI